MNKLIISLALVAALLLTACGTETQETAPVETPIAEPVVAEEPMPPPAAKNPNEFYIKKGDSITYKGNAINIEDITNGGSLVSLILPDSTRLNIAGTKTPEISNGMEFEITAVNFTKDRSVTLNIKDFVPGQNEYFLSKGEKADVAGSHVELGSITTDSGYNTWVNIAIDETDYTVKLGETKTTGNFEITALRAFYRNKESALLKIIPK